jgi:beta-1,4-mannosyl-glycoprotein beta-1,4-N-acetylglucosaminyltransferase
MKVLDCFIFYNELDMLKYRLDTLSPYVDKFILVEAYQTFVGKPKPLYYDMHKDTLFSAYKDKIQHVIVNLDASSEEISRGDRSAWDNERQQRNTLKSHIEATCTDDSDLIFLSDVDEITDPSIIQHLKSNPDSITVASLEQDLYYYTIHCKFQMKWRRSKVFRYSYLKSTTLSIDDIRLSNPDTILPRAGWHLSYFGDVSFIQNKVKNFSHTECNTDEITSPEYIQSCIANSQCLFKGFTIEYIPLESNNYLPPNHLSLSLQNC